MNSVTFVCMAKALTREQVAARQRKAVAFTDNVRDDPDRAAELERLSVEEYARERGFSIANSDRRSRKFMATKRQLERENQELREEVDSLNDKLDQIFDVIEEDEEAEEGDEPD